MERIKSTDTSTEFSIRETNLTTNVEFINRDNGVTSCERLPLGFKIYVEWTLCNDNTDNYGTVSALDTPLMGSFTTQTESTLEENVSVVSTKPAGWFLKEIAQTNYKL